MHASGIRSLAAPALRARGAAGPTAAARRARPAPALLRRPSAVRTPWAAVSSKVKPPTAPARSHSLCVRAAVAEAEAEAEAEAGGSFFHQGLSTLKVPYSLHAENRDRVLTKFRKALDEKGGRVGVAYLFFQGGKALQRAATDIEPVFRQESFFHYMFGVSEEGVFGAVHASTGDAILFVPRLPDEYAVWMGEIRSLDHYKKKYGVVEVHYVNEMETVLTKKNAKLYVLDGENTDSGRRHPVPTFPAMKNFEVDTELLHPLMIAARAIKSEAEIAVMKYASAISSQAHIEVMRQCQPGQMEYMLESVFAHVAYSAGGCRHTAYTSICASGPNSAVLHYGHAGAPNNKQLEDGELILMDMGAEYHCYAADITCTYPVNGVFTYDQKVVYNAVLDAHQGVIKSLKPGVAWADMHMQAERTILDALCLGGFLRGNLDDMMSKRLGAVLMPHGLGHLLGIDTHDVGGYLPRGIPRFDSPGLRKLRTTRTMEAGMVITVEPGCYFNNYLLDQAKNDPEMADFFNWKKIDSCRKMGGVRIEDNVVITEDGAYSLTNVPRTVDDIEDVMAGLPWPN